MIWSTSKLANAIEEGTLGFTGVLRTNSLMLSLGSQIQEFREGTEPVDICDIASLKSLYKSDAQVLTTYVLSPHSSLLIESEEVLAMPVNATGLMSGLSHVARCGLFVHFASMFVEPGYQGHICFEVLNSTPSPIILRCGMAVAKLKLISMENGATDAQPELDQGWYGEHKSLRSRYAVEYLADDRRNK